MPDLWSQLFKGPFQIRSLYLDFFKMWSFVINVFPKPGHLATRYTTALEAHGYHEDVNGNTIYFYIKTTPGKEGEEGYNSKKLCLNIMPVSQRSQCPPAPMMLSLSSGQC